METSYCVTLYNKAAHIERVLRAILAEHEGTGGEILVYDDASTDGSAAIVRRMAQDRPIRLIEGARNLGVFAATEALIRQSRAPWLRLVDGDDLVTEGSTLALGQALEALGADLVHGEIVAADTAWPTPPGGPCHVVRHAFRGLLTRMSYNLSSSLLRTSSAEAALPLPDGIRISQDLCLALRLARRGVLGRIGGVTALAPPESANRLSRRVAAMYGDFCRIIAAELEPRGSAADAAFAVRRNAARCRRYFTREAPGVLRAAERRRLARLLCSPPWQGTERSCRELAFIASLYDRDRDRVLS